VQQLVHHEKLLKTSKSGRRVVYDVVIAQLVHIKGSTLVSQESIKLAHTHACSTSTSTGSGSVLQPVSTPSLYGRAGMRPDSTSRAVVAVVRKLPKTAFIAVRCTDSSLES